MCVYYVLVYRQCLCVCPLATGHNSLSIFKFMHSLSLELYLDCGVLDKYLTKLCCFPT